MVFAFVSGMLADPEQWTFGRRWKVVDAQAFELRRVERSKGLRDESCRGVELSGDFLRVLLVVASECHAAVTVHRGHHRLVFHECDVEPVALHEEYVTHVAGVLES